MGPGARSDWSKTHGLSEYKPWEKRGLLFFATLPVVDIFVRDGGKKFFFRKFMMETFAKQQKVLRMRLI